MKIAQSRFAFTLLVALTFILILGQGCTAKKTRFELPPEELLKQGKKFIKEGLTLKARDAFQQLLEEYPNSQERISALMLLGDLHYNDEEFEEAKFQYVRFAQQHPAHKYVDRAYFYSAMSDFRQMDIASRDQTHTQKSIRGFELLIKTYPDSQYAAQSQINLDKAKQTLAENMFEIGKFYFRTQSFQSSIRRLKNVIEEYPEQHFIDEALYLLGESYLKEQNFEAAKSTFKQLLEKYPRSKFIQKARLHYRNSSKSKRTEK